MLGKTKILNASINMDGLPRWAQMDDDNQVIPKDVVSNFRFCSGIQKSEDICKFDDLSKPLIIKTDLELSGLIVDLSGKRIRFNVSCGDEFIVKQSALQVWREGKLSIKKMVVEVFFIKFCH